MSPRTGLLLAVAASLLAAGCGDADLWARYRAERDFWRARRQVDRIQVNPQLATDQDYARAQRSFAAIPRRFPPQVWARAERARGTALGVAMASGRAAVAVARIDDLRGQTARAIDGYARVMEDYRAVPVVALEAAIARARALERLGRADEALGAWSQVAWSFPLVDTVRGDAFLPVLDAPLRLAHARRLRGDRAGADSVLRAAERRISEALPRHSGRAPAPDLWMRLSDARAARGDLDGALDALRQAMAEPAAGSIVPRLVLRLGERCLEGGRPDSALAYAAWAEHGFGGLARPDALLLTARAWDVKGPPDSALAAYQRFLDAYGQIPDPSARARFRRGLILEGLGRWEQARTEYRALAAAQPTHELGFAALTRIVVHHASRGERDLALAEGRRALETLDRIIAGQRDETVLFLARRTRADLMLAIGDDQGALGALADLWQRYPTTTVGLDAGLRAAALAAARPGGQAQARELYEQLSTRATDPQVQRQARAALERLRRGGG